MQALQGGGGGGGGGGGRWGEMVEGGVERRGEETAPFHLFIFFRLEHFVLLFCTCKDS